MTMRLQILSILMVLFVCQATAIPTTINNQQPTINDNHVTTATPTKYLHCSKCFNSIGDPVTIKLCSKGCIPDNLKVNSDYKSKKVFRRWILVSTTKIPCYECINENGILGIKDPVKRKLCIKGCATVERPTTTAVTTTTTTTTTTLKIQQPTTTQTLTPKQQRSTINLIKTSSQYVIMENAYPSDDVSIQHTVYLWVLVGFLGFGVVLSIIVIAWKHAGTTERNRVGISQLVLEGNLKRDIFVIQ